MIPDPIDLFINEDAPPTKFNLTVVDKDGIYSGSHYTWTFQPPLHNFFELSVASKIVAEERIVENFEPFLEIEVSSSEPVVELLNVSVNDGISSAPFSVAITVKAVNDQPTAQNVIKVVDYSVLLHPVYLQGHDDDHDILSFSLESLPGCGEVYQASDSITPLSKFIAPERVSHPLGLVLLDLGTSCFSAVFTFVAIDPSGEVSPPASVNVTRPAPLERAVLQASRHRVLQNVETNLKLNITNFGSNDYVLRVASLPEFSTLFTIDESSKCFIELAVDDTFVLATWFSGLYIKSPNPVGGVWFFFFFFFLHLIA